MRGVELPRGAPVVRGEELVFYPLVESVEVTVGEDWACNNAPRDTAECLVEAPVLQISRLK
jgi:hypothetical protein